MADALIDETGQTTRSLRKAVMDHAGSLGDPSEAPADVPAELVAFVDKVAREAYKTTDEDFEGLRAKGYSEDELFELTLSAAVGASLARMQQGLRALREAD